jgi:hypothetical protein
MHSKMPYNNPAIYVGLHSVSGWIASEMPSTVSVLRSAPLAGPALLCWSL